MSAADHFLAKRSSFDFWDLVATMATKGDAMQLVGIRDLNNKLPHNPRLKGFPPICLPHLSVFEVELNIHVLPF